MSGKPYSFHFDQSICAPCTCATCEDLQGCPEFYFFFSVVQHLEQQKHVAEQFGEWVCRAALKGFADRHRIWMLQGGIGTGKSCFNRAIFNVLPAALTGVSSIVLTLFI